MVTSYTQTYHPYKDGLVDLALPVELDQELTEAMDADSTVADRLGDAITAQLRRHGVDTETGEWYGDWSAESIVHSILTNGEHPTLHIRGYDGCSPTRELDRALRSLAPDLFRTDRNRTDRNRADLLLVPRTDERRDDNAWYDLYWAHPAVEVGEDGAGLALPPTEVGDDSGIQGLTMTPIRHVTTFGRPPRRPAEQLAAAAGPVDTTGYDEGVLRAYGGTDGVRDILEKRRMVAYRHGNDVAVYDWSILAFWVAGTIRNLHAPKLTATQRAHVAAARLLAATQRVAAERESLAAHLCAAEQTGEDLTGLHAVIAALDPTLGGTR